MFGRKKDEDFEDYNESRSSKYDDDYIAESEEYRSGDTEPNYAENDEEHEKFTDPESIFGDKLKNGEKILWCAQEGGYKKTDKGRFKPDERKSKIANIISKTGLILAIVSIPIPLPVFYVLMYVGFAVFLVGGFFKAEYAPHSKRKRQVTYYALTTKRVIVLASLGNYSVYYRDISSTDFEFSSDKKHGDVHFVAKHILFENGKDHSGSLELKIFDIEDPDAVKVLLDKMIDEARKPLKSRK